MSGTARRPRSVADPAAGPCPAPPYRGGVYRFLLTPRWWGINVFVLLSIPFCIFMGSWQLGRFEDRVQDHRTATEQVSEARHEAPRPLKDMLPVDKATASSCWCPGGSSTADRASTC